MAAFLIVEIKKIHDEKLFAEYRDKVSPNLADAGGAYVVRGGQMEVLEGDWHPTRVVVIRFDSADAARKWWRSSDYADLKAMRLRSATTNMILVEGVA